MTRDEKMIRDLEKFRDKRLEWNPYDRAHIKALRRKEQISLSVSFLVMVQIVRLIGRDPIPWIYISLLALWVACSLVIFHRASKAIDVLLTLGPGTLDKAIERLRARSAHDKPGAASDDPPLSDT